MTEQEILKIIGSIADSKNIPVWAVGGYVRDQILNKTVKDIDFAVVGDGTGFARLVAKELRTRNIVIYPKFGTALVDYNEYRLEFVTARSESYIEDSRNPIVTGSDLNADLLRRDFTINCIAFGLNAHNFGEIYDPLEGQKDIAARIIRTPLDPAVTFKDDPLRIMRAIRFAAQLGFAIEQSTFNALKEMRGRLEIISQERITDELKKIIMAPRPSIGFYLLDDAGVLEIVFREFMEMKGVEQREGYHHKDAFHHTLMVVDNVAEVSDKFDLRFAALVHDIAKPQTKRFV
ncbi:MAG TPA: CCA tRNA nucleotidyltransferase, partial [bacterium]